jgi:4-hydroxybenzoate polyprenyltransferase
LREVVAIAKAFSFCQRYNRCPSNNLPRQRMNGFLARGTLARFPIYWRLMRMDKPIGIMLLMWPTLWALWLSSGGLPETTVLVVFILGTVLMRAAGCVINDIADRHFDGHVERTQHRPLVAGHLGVREAIVLFLVLVLLSFGLVLWLNNTLVLWLSIPALFLAGSYPFTKRFFAIPQAYLGIAFGFGIPMAYAAHLGSVPFTAWALLLANVFWAVAYDTEYAMVDRADDLKIGIKTSAITFGRFDVMAVMACYGLALTILMWVGRQSGLGWIFSLGLFGAGCVAAYHYTLIGDRQPSRCFKAFLHNNYFGLAVFVGLVADYTFR